jgi:hypothetical protein
MRLTLICLAALVVAFIGYAYDRDPAGCQKIGDDFVTLIHHITPASLQPNGAAPAPSAETTNAAPAAPTPTPTPPPTPTPVTVAAPPLPPAPPPWSPPAVTPAQPNWTWTTSDGKTYQDVVITKIEPDTVSITHSMGVGHIAINLLPPDIQKQLNYDPDAAAAAHAENVREDAHPYYSLTALAEAQGVARQLRKPIAWMCANLDALQTANPPTDSEGDLAQMALNHLKSRAVVVFLNSNADLGLVTPFIREQQFYQLDDGPIPGGHHFYGPKIVFTDADITKALGRVSFTQMKAARELAIDEVLDAIPKEAAAAAAPSTNATPSVPAPGSPPKP